MNNFEKPPTQSEKRPLESKQLLLIALVALALAVVVLLPNYVSGPWFTPDLDSAGINAIKSAPSAGSLPLSPSQIAEEKQYRQDAQNLLAQIVKLRDALESKGAENWGKFMFSSVLEKIDRGDNQYIDGDYNNAISSYGEALDYLKKLRTLAETTLDNALKKGFESLENGDLEALFSATATANEIAPDAMRVQRLSTRAALLPEIIPQLEKARAQLTEGRLENAIAIYQRILAIDNENIKAKRALSQTQEKKLEREFITQMSRGWQALDENQFAGAEQAFTKASAINPNRPGIDQAFAQLSTRRSNFKSMQQLQRALQWESEEQWQQALEIYDKMLADDNSLTEPMVRRVNASVRAELELQVKTLLADPLVLSDASRFQRGTQLLADLTGIADTRDSVRSNIRLRTQINDLDAALQRSQTSTEIVFRSDGLTQVTLYRISKLGAFADTRLQLKPGRYRVAGARDGYRDVLIEFIIDGKSPSMSVDIRCVDLI